MEGSLTLSASEQKKYFGYNYTSAAININIQNFTSVYSLYRSELVFRFRAAQPMIYGLKPVIRIEFELINTTTPTPIYVNLLYITDQRHCIDWTKFNNYEVIFKGHNITWKVNGIEVTKAKFPIPSKVNIMHFENPYFRIKDIVIYLDVNDKSLSKNHDQLNDKCSTFIIDYFRYYFRNDSQMNKNIPQWEKSENTKVNEICAKINNEKKLNSIMKFIPDPKYTKLTKQYAFEKLPLNQEEWIFRKDVGNKLDQSNYTIEDGILKISKSKYKYYSRSEVTTKASFKLGRIEIRAKRSRSFYYMTEFYLEQRKSGFRTSGMVKMDLFDLDKDSWIIAKIRKIPHRINQHQSDITMFNPDDFHTYGFEINEDYITWFIDDRVLYRVNKIDINEEFWDLQAFKQTYNLHMRFGERYFGASKSKDHSHLNRDWLEVESIKVYGEGSLITTTKSIK